MTWRPARSLITLRDQVNAAHPGRSTAGDGMVASSAHHQANPSSDHEPRLIRGEWVVCAFDITTGTWTQSMVDALVASRDSRIKYVIWNRRFCAGVPGWGSAPWVWVPYTGTDPHTGHVHLSVNAANCDDTRPWAINVEDDMSAEEVKAIRADLVQVRADINNLFYAVIGGTKPPPGREHNGVGTMQLSEQNAKLAAQSAALLAAVGKLAAANPAVPFDMPAFQAAVEKAGADGARAALLNIKVQLSNDAARP